MSLRARLGIDYGTSNTVAVLHLPGRPARTLLFDGSPQLPSAVFAESDGAILTGSDALHCASVDPARVEPNPKRRVTDQVVLLGDTQIPVTGLVAATFRRVRDEAYRVAGGELDELVLTFPAAWGPQRRSVLTEAARAAGLPAPRFVPEPVAAAAYFVTVLGAQVPVGHCVVIYDFGAGTFDASVVRRVPDGFSVLAAEGLADTGGLDVDAAVVTGIFAAHPSWDPDLRTRLEQPESSGDRRARAEFWQEVRSAKEMLSRGASTFIHVPLLDVDVPLGREHFERLARPALDETMGAIRRTIVEARIGSAEISGVFLVGGSSRIPLAATLLHRTLGIAPTVLDQPELVVAEGALLAVGPPVASAVGSAPGIAVVSTVRSAQPLALARGIATAAAPTVDLIRVSPGGGVPRRRPRLFGVLMALLALVVAVGAGLALRTSGVFGGGDDRGNGASGPSRSAGTTYPAALAGTWSGTMQQTNGPKWYVTVTVVSGATTATVVYSGLGCRGTWTLTGANGSILYGLEKIVQGQENCTDNGVVTLTPDARGQVAVEYVPADRSYRGNVVLARSVS